VGVEDAETKLSLEDTEPALEGLASAVSSGDVGFDESCPSVPALAIGGEGLRASFRDPSLLSSSGDFPGSSLLFFGTSGRILADVEALLVGDAAGGAWSGACLSSFSKRVIAI
jgi:hypothetical protein